MKKPKVRGPYILVKDDTLVLTDPIGYFDDCITEAYEFATFEEAKACLKKLEAANAAFDPEDLGELVVCAIGGDELVGVCRDCGEPLVPTNPGDPENGPQPDDVENKEVCPNCTK